MKAISIRQPWAWLIINGLKDIENRTWCTTYRGPVLIHASSRVPTKAECAEAQKILTDNFGINTPRVPEPHYFALGGIVGGVTITDCVETSDSPWFLGPKGFILSEAFEVKISPMKGRLSFFETGLRKHQVFNLLVPEFYHDTTESSRIKGNTDDN
ncbi:ASCH domain-containing protein [Yersinia enterocolitica]